MSKAPSDDDVKFAAEMILANAEAEACDDENSDETRLAARCDGIIAGFYLRHLADLARVTAERDKLMAAVERIRSEIAWLDGIDPHAIAIADYDGSASIIKACCDAVIAETHNQQPQPEN